MQKKGFGKKSLLSWVASRGEKSDKDDKKSSWRPKVVKEAKKDHDFGKKNGKNTGFKTVEKKAEKEYGSKEAGKKVAASVFWKMQNKKK